MPPYNDPSHRASTGNSPDTSPSLTITVPPCTGGRTSQLPPNPNSPPNAWIHQEFTVPRPNGSKTCLTPPTPSTTSPPCTGGRTDQAQTNPTLPGPARGLVACLSRGPSPSLSRLPCINKFRNNHDTRSTKNPSDKKLESSPPPTSLPAGKTTPSPPPPRQSSTAPRTGASQPPGQPGSRSPPSLVQQEEPRKIKINLESKNWKQLETLPSSHLLHRAADIGPPPPPSSRPCSTAPGTWAPKPPGQQASRSPPSLGEKSKPEKKKSAMQLYKLARQLPDPPPPPSRTADPSPHPSRPCSTAPGTWAPEPPGQAASSSPPSLVQQDRTEKGKLELNRYKQLEPLPDPPPPPSNRAADPSPPLPPPPPRVCSTAPGRWASQSTQASVSSPPPGPTEKEKPKIKKLKINPWQPIESSPSGTPRWASSRTACTPAAGMRGSQPGQHQDCGRT